MRRSLIPVLLLSALTTGCSQETAFDVCGRRTSLASVTGVLSQGLDAVAAESSASLRLDIIANQNVLNAARVDAPDGVVPSIDEVLSAYAEVETALDSVDWDLAVAASDVTVQKAVEEVTDGSALVASATVESYLFSKCGAPMAAAADEVAPATLPPSTQLGTDVTDPDTSPLQTDSEVAALGILIGNSFQLTLTADEAFCLGEEVSKVVDYSNQGSSSAQYISQYQRAFDACGIDFDVPT
ncbi:MAG: hypothetical protein FJW98_02555 [Actinobacteria bacterium]|nr:hypothetical protein [Actinomycetota bacterium]